MKRSRPEHGADYTSVSAGTLRKGDAVLVEAGDFIPGDGAAIEGVASVDESAVTSERSGDRGASGA